MWNFDKIQLFPMLFTLVVCCGLMWNFDKIQRPTRKYVDGTVVV